jgi:hypothetical protein
MKNLKLLGITAVLASLLTASLPLVMADNIPATATVNGYVSLTFSPEYSEIAFSDVDQDSANNPAGNNTLYHVNVTTNGDVTLTWSQADLTSDGNTIVKANVKMTYDVNTPASTDSGDATAMGSPIEQASLANGDQVYANYWLDVPALQAQGAYSGDQSITAETV